MKTTILQKLPLAAGLLAASVLMPSCTKDFEELRKDPNRVQEVTPGSLLGPVVYQTVTASLNRTHRLNNEMMQVSVSRIANSEFHRYVIRASESDYLWDNYYRQLTNVQSMYDEAMRTNQPNYAAAALVLRAWIFSMLTDTFGDVPYSEANQGYKNGVFQPRFDEQKDIYAGLLADLEQANAMFDPAKGFVFGGDVLYDYGDALPDADQVLKWRKFCNSLRLRLLLRGLNRPELGAAAKIQTIVADPVAFPIFQSNADGAVLQFTGSAPLLSPFATFRDYDFNGERSYSEFFINNLHYTNTTGARVPDPRLPLWATLPSDRVFRGIPSGYAVNQTPAVEAILSSRYLATLKTTPRLGTIMGYAELQFILAEAAQRGLIAGAAKDYYEKGVRASIEYWGGTVPTGFFDLTGVKFDNTLAKIMLQKYYALFFNDFQQWHEYRRTGLPALPRGTALQNNGQMPTRLKYPVLVQSVNKANYDAAVARMGTDDMLTRVWWQN